MAGGDVVVAVGELAAVVGVAGGGNGAVGGRVAVAVAVVGGVVLDGWGVPIGVGGPTVGVGVGVGATVAVPVGLGVGAAVAVLVGTVVGVAVAAGGGAGACAVEYDVAETVTATAKLRTATARSINPTRRSKAVGRPTVLAHNPMTFLEFDRDLAAHAGRPPRSRIEWCDRRKERETEHAVRSRGSVPRRS